MSDGQVNHHWYDWNEMATDHIRSFKEDDFTPQAAHKIIHTDQMNGSRGVEINYIVEFQAPCAPDYKPRGMVAQSFAKFVFPKLHFPRWHRPGGSIAVVRHPGISRWLTESLTTPLMGILTSKLLYITTDDPGDFALIKMRCEEYRGE